MVALSRNVSRKHAMEMLLTGEMIGAVRAEAIGLINRAVDEQILDETVYRMARTIADKSSHTLKIGKEAFLPATGAAPGRGLRFHVPGDGGEPAGGGRQRGHLRVPGQAQTGMERPLISPDSPNPQRPGQCLLPVTRRSPTSRPCLSKKPWFISTAEIKLTPAG